MTILPKLNTVGLLLAAAACCAWHGADCAELPKRKPGQWQITLTSDDTAIPPRVEDICLDESTDALMYKFALGASEKMCTKNEWKDLGGGRFSVDVTCNMGTTRMTSHGETVFTGSTAYREDVKTHYEPPLHGRSDATSLHEARWTGACAADMKPGDIVMRPTARTPNGMRFNVNEMLKR